MIHYIESLGVPHKFNTPSERLGVDGQWFKIVVRDTGIIWNPRMSILNTKLRNGLEMLVLEAEYKQEEFSKLKYVELTCMVYSMSPMTDFIPLYRIDDGNILIYNDYEQTTR